MRQDGLPPLCAGSGLLLVLRPGIVPMKVLTPGRPQKGWAAEAECSGRGNGGGGCGALLLVEQGDLYWTSSGHYDGSVDRYVTFRCPECGVETDIEGTPPPLPRET